MGPLASACCHPPYCKPWNGKQFDDTAMDLFEEMDTDQNGCVTWDEAEAFFIEKMNWPEEMIEIMFKGKFVEADKDGNGCLTREEAGVLDPLRKYLGSKAGRLPTTLVDKMKAEVQTTADV